MKVLQQVRDLDGKPGPSDERFVGGFLGEINAKKFVVRRLFGGKPSDFPDPTLFHIVHPDGRDSGHILGLMPEPERVSSHTLTLVTEHDVDGKPIRFKGQHQLDVRHPLAMVIPEGVAGFDTALNGIAPYADHWQQHQPGFRHVERTKIFVTRNITKLEPHHYDDMIAKLKAAAEKALCGVVALSVGHGSGTLGQEGVPFINIVPEDNKKAVTGKNFLLRIDETDLAQFDEDKAIKPIPSRNQRVRLDALDRLAEALKDTPIRRLLLHTCNAGLAPDFVQMFANRIRVPVMAQKDFIIFQGQPEPASFYESDKKPTLPRDERFWPMHRCDSVKFPRDKPPPKLGPP